MAPNVNSQLSQCGASEQSVEQMRHELDGPYECKAVATGLDNGSRIHSKGEEPSSSFALNDDEFQAKITSLRKMLFGEGNEWSPGVRLSHSGWERVAESQGQSGHGEVFLSPSGFHLSALDGSMSKSSSP